MDNATRLEIVRLKNEGLNGVEIASKLGLKPRRVQEFLARDRGKEFWEWYDKSLQAKYLTEKSELDGKVSGEGMSYIDISKHVHQGLDTGHSFPPLQYRPDDVAFKKGAVDGVGKKILVIADTQCKPSEDLDYMRWIGEYIAEKRPDVIVHIGDNYDTPSLSSYDKGKKSFEGRRLRADIDAGTQGIKLLVDAFDSDDYNPRMVFCLGNHEERLDRLANDFPELDGFVGTDLLPLESFGWEVHPFLKPVEIEGIFFVHYLANPFTGKPYAGTALNQLKTVGRSFVVGHKQCLDVAIRPTIDGKQQIGIINGACYPFDEGYKGHQGNIHFRGITMLHEVKDGFGLPMFVSLDYLKSRYE